MLRAPRTATALLALLAAAAACTGGSSDAPPGPAGPQGPTGPAGPRGPAGVTGAAAPAIVVRTATGELLGPAVGGPARAAAPFPGPVPVWISALGRVALVDLATGEIQANAAVVFAADGCAGPAYGAGEMSEQTVAVNGSRLFALSSTAPVAVTARSALMGGECLPLETAGAYFPAVELADPRYRYAAPLRIAYE